MSMAAHRHTHTHTHHSPPPFTSSSTPQRRRAFDRTMLDRWEKNKSTQTTSFDRPICLSFPLGNKNSHWLRYERQPAQDMRERSWRETRTAPLFPPPGPTSETLVGAGVVRPCLASPFPAGLFSFNGRLALIRSRVAQTRRPPDPAWSGRADLSLSGDSLAPVKNGGLGGVPEIVLGRNSTPMGR